MTAKGVLMNWIPSLRRPVSTSAELTSPSSASSATHA